SGLSRRLEQRLVLEAVRRPGNGLEPLRLDRAAVDETFSEGPVVNASECIAYLLQNHRIELSPCELGIDGDVGHARIPAVVGRIDQFSATVFEIAIDTRAEIFFELQYALFVTLAIHYQLSM